MSLVPQEGSAHLSADHRHVVAAKIEREVCDPGRRKDSDLPAFEVVGVQSIVIVILSALETGVTQERISLPFIDTLQASHGPSPQPYLAPADGIPLA